MGKTGKWLKKFLTGKKVHKDHQLISSSNNDSLSLTPVPKEKKRWSFRRSPAKDLNPPESNVNGGASTPPDTSAQMRMDMENEQHALAVAAAAVAAAQAAAAAVLRLTAAESNAKANVVEEAAAIKIQSVFRSYLARKALYALKGLVKLQAMVRGHLVRKRANDTLRCMQALVTAQTRARTQRIKMAETENHYSNPTTNHHWNSIHIKAFQENCLKQTDQIDREMEENVKIVEMDKGESKISLKNRNSYSYSKTENNYYLSPARSALTEHMSPRTFSGHFEDYAFGTTQSSPQYYSAISKPDPSRLHDFEFPRSEYAESLCYDYPSYMANTESSKAKAVRSQSAPKARPPDSFERQPSRRRASVEGRNIPRAVRMQRSSSHLGPAAQSYAYPCPWPIKLDRSTVSLKDSECGSTYSVRTNSNYIADSRQIRKKLLEKDPN